MDDVLGVEPGSPAGAEGQVDSSAGTQNTDPTTGQPFQPPQSVPYGRFAEVNGRMRGAESRAQAAEGRAASAEARLQALEKAAQRQGGDLTAEQQAEYRQAGDALLRIIQAHPELQKLMGVPQTFEAIQTQLQDAQAAQYTDQARGVLWTLYGQSGLPNTPLIRNTIEDAVTGLIQRTPQALAAYRSGNPQMAAEVVARAFQVVRQQFVGELQKGNPAALAAQRTRLSNLPPRGIGGGPGTPAQKPPEPGKERDFLEQAHRRAFEMLSAG